MARPVALHPYALLALVYLALFAGIVILGVSMRGGAPWLYAPCL